MKVKNKYLISLALICLVFFVKAQNYPVQITTILSPPFSGYLPDYAAGGNNDLKIILLFNDFSKPSYNVKLKFKLSGQNINIENKNFYFEGPVTLIPGVPMELSGSDLGGLLNSNNLNFNGISKQQYETSKVLPEGLYQICITAYDFNNPTAIQVSNNSCASAWMMLNDPPFLNIPVCGSSQQVTNPQNIIFQWTSMNLASPNSAFNTQYEFSLYEIRPKGANPNNIIQTLPPIYQTTTSLLSLNYGITEPILNLGMEYVWRVKAIDNSGRDLFKNNGYSQYCTFTYGSMSQFIDSSLVALNLQGAPVSYRMLKCFWDTLNVYKNYKLFYRKLGGNNWFTNSNISRSYDYINELEAENTYQIYLKGIMLDNSEGPPSNTITITTPKKADYVCGQGNGVPTNNYKPLQIASIGQTWDVGQFEMIVTSLKNMTHPNGIYSGYGKVRIKFLGVFNVKFDQIMVSEEMRVIAGQVNVLTDGIGKWLASFKYPPGWNMTDSIKVNGPLNNVTVTPQGQILVNGQPVGNAGGNTVLTGNGGTVVYVSTNGSVTVEDYPKEEPVGEIFGINDSLAVIKFDANANTQYGIDAKEIMTLTAGEEYEALQHGKDGYDVAFKLLVTGTKDEIEASIGDGIIKLDSSKVKFKRSDGTVLSHTINASGNYVIDINGRLNLFSDALWAFGKKKNSNDTNWYAVGKINLVCADKKIKEVKLIPVNGLGTNLVAATMETELNAIYKKAGVEWKVSIDSNLVVSDYNMDSTLIVSRNNLNTTYGTDLKRIINTYKNKVSSISNEISYVFVCNKATNGELGYMALNKRYGFVFAQGNNNMSHSLAHELGHGNLVLKHTFEEGTGGQSQNLMDYAGGTYFNHGQWLNVHDPNTLDNLLNTLVQDEESGSYQTDGHYSTIYLIGKMLGVPNYTALAYYTECWDNEIHDAYYIVNTTWANRLHQLMTHALTNGYHALEEFKTAVGILNADINNYRELGRLIHRYGDCFAHTRIKTRVLPDSLKRMYGKLLAIPVVSPLTYGFDTIYFNYTIEHFHPDKSDPDLIAVDPNWYLSYVDNITELLSTKFNVPINQAIKPKFTELANYAETFKVSLIGIIDYEIAAIEGLKEFYLRFPRAALNNNLSKLTVFKDEIPAYLTYLSNTINYLNFKKVKYKILWSKGYLPNGNLVNLPPVKIKFE